jgi:ABC transport system ATP-binding/permease protein
VRRAALTLADRTVDVEGDGATLGSAAHCEIVLRAIGVAGEHARVSYHAGCWWLESLKIGTTTQVNGHPIPHGQRHLLVTGATILLGSEQIGFAIRGATPYPRPALPARRGAAPPPRTPTSVPWPTPRRPTTIGRDPSNVLPIDDPNVSRFHAEVVLRDGAAVLRDLRSTNGTKVNGELVREQVVTPADTIGIGPRELLLAGAAPTVARPRARVVPPVLSVGAVELATRGPRGRRRLHPTSFEVGAGELVAIIGPSGSGKSTLLKIVAGVLRSSGGTIAVQGEPRAQRTWDVGYVSQDDILHRLLTVRETMRCAARLRLSGDITTAEIDARAATVLSDLRIPMERYGDRLPDRLSGGERKRLSVATELVGDPRLLLLDEPTSGLDPNADKSLMRQLRAMASGERAVVVVTHTTRWLRLCDRLLVIDGGRLALAATPAEVREHFGVEDLDDMYDRLGRTIAPDPPSTARRGRTAATAARLARPQRLLPRTVELRVLAGRTARGIWRDRINLALLALPVPIFGGLIALLFGREAFGAHAEVTKSAQLLFTLVFVATMLGTIGGIRELLRERSAYVRESALGVRLSSYLASKLLVLGAIATLQGVLLGATTFVLAPLHAGVPVYAGLLVLLGTCSVTALAVGLLISACARTDAQAVTFLNFALAPQLLFAGAIVAVQDMRVVRPIAAGMPARWAYAGVGAAIDLMRRGRHDDGFNTFYGDAFFAIHTWSAMLVLSAMASAAIALTVLLLRRQRG